MGRGFIYGDAVSHWEKVNSFVVKDGYFDWYWAKPGHHFLMTIFYLLFGPSPDSALFMSVCAGTLSVLFVYLSAYNFWGRYAALASGILVLFSPLHNYYSRIAGSQITSVLFFSIFLYYLSLLKRDKGGMQWVLLLAGVFLSLSITCHYNIGLWLFAIIVPLTVYYSIYDRKNMSNYLIFFLFGCCVPLIIFELFFIFQKYYISRPEIENYAIYEVKRFPDYWEQIIIQIFIAKGSAGIWGKYWSMWRYFTEYISKDTPIIMIFLFVSIVYSIVKKNVRIILLLISPTVLYLLFFNLFKSSGFLRNIASLIPVIYVIGGSIFQELGKNKKVLKYGTYIIISICIISSLYSWNKIWGHINIKPSISEVIRRKAVQENAKYLIVPPAVELNIHPFQMEVIKDFPELTPLETAKYFQYITDSSYSYALFGVTGENPSVNEIKKILSEYAVKNSLKPLELISSYKTGESRHIALVRLGFPKK